jgi:CheY-like chemotaxis protein/c-di-GMP-binding flagellar brake protein YcgR
LDGGANEPLQDSTPDETCSAGDLVAHVNVGDAAFLDLNVTGDHDQRFRTVFQGWELGKYIVLKRPEACKALSLAKGRMCAVRFVHEGDVWGFYASLATEIHPFSEDRTVLVTWPKSARRLRVRRHERISLGIACEASYTDGGTEHGMIQDLSGGGCRVSISRALELGDLIELTFEMPGTGETMHRSVVIRNRGADPEGALQYGCQFQNETDDVQYGIEYYVARTLAGNRGEAPPHPQIFVLSSDTGDAALVRHALRSAGLDVVAARDVLNLGAQIEHSKPVGLLISGDLPDLEATVACRLVRRTQGLGELPVVIYGGDAALESKAVDAGASAWIADAAQVAAVSRLFTD